MAKLKL